MTLNKPIIMGRKNYESIGRPLPQRHNIIITRCPEFKAAGCTIVHSFAAALAAAGDVPEVMIIGGAQIYELALELADTMYLTYIAAETKGDTFFPAWSDTQWQEVSRETHPADEKHPYAFSFVSLVRRTCHSREGGKPSTD